MRRRLGPYSQTTIVTIVELEPAMKLGAVVLHYRYWPEISATLQALISQSRPPEMTVVVDNQSGDESIRELMEAYPLFTYIQASENRGYAAGMNQGIDAMMARGVDALLLLTHECRLAPNALEILLCRLVENPSVGAVGPLLCLLSREEEVFSAGVLIDPRTWEMRHLGMREGREDWVGRGTHSVDWLDGACILLRSDVIRQTGHLDERYFLYFEETEYLIRARREGWGVECVTSAVAWQEPGRQPPYLNARNKLGFLASNAPKRCLMRAVVRLIGKLARDLVHPRTSYARRDIVPQLRGIMDFAVGRWGPPA